MQKIEREHLDEILSQTLTLIFWSMDESYNLNDSQRSYLSRAYANVKILRDELKNIK